MLETPPHPKLVDLIPQVIAVVAEAMRAMKTGKLITCGLLELAQGRLQ